MKKQQIVFMKSTHQNFNLYIGNKENYEWMKTSEMSDPLPEKVIPIESLLKKKELKKINIDCFSPIGI